MNLSISSVSLISASFLLVGCDSKEQKQKAADQVAADEFAEFSKQNTERIAEHIEAEGSYLPDSTDSIDQYVELVERTSDEVSPELAAQLKSQAEVLKEIQGLIDPYLELNNKLQLLGGMDAATLASVEDLDNRISIIQQLAIMNDQIDSRYPELFMQITGSDSPEGDRQLAMAKEIRQADRDAYPHMMQSLQIVRKYWDTSGNADDGLFYFGNDVPEDVILRYNQHLSAVEAIGERQLEIQKKYYTEP